MDALKAPPTALDKRGWLFGRWNAPPLRSRAWWIAAIYALFAALWIYYSDHALLLVASPDQLLKISVYKGWAFVLLTSLLLLMMMRRAYGATEQAYASLQTQAERLRESERRLRTVLASAMDAIIAVDGEHRVILFNDAAARMFGYQKNRAMGQSLLQFLPDGMPAQESGPVVTEGQRASGDRFPAEVSRSTVDARDQGLLTLVLRDVTERIGHEQEIERLNHLYEALSQINQAIVWTKTEAELLAKVCRTLCEVGALRIAWIGRHDEHSKRIMPIAIHGDSEGFMDGIEIFSDLRPEGMDPTGTAFRENRSYICNDLGRDPATRHWRERAMRLGLRSSASFPIRVHGKPSAVLVVSAAEIGFFKDKEVALLEEAAIDISFALENLRRDEEHRLSILALRDSEQRYRNTLDNILEGCQLIDFDWRYVYLNDAAAIHNRRPNTELLGQRMPDVWPGIVDTDVFAMLKNCMEQRRQVHQEIEFRFPDGSLGWFDLRAQPVPEGIFILSVDITDRHHAEIALREVNENLEQLVAKRTAELEQALLAAESADRLKSAFLATMSHELRTPLNSIIGFTGIVLQQLAGPLTAEQSKQLGMVKKSAHHLLALINDVLDLSKIEAGQLEMQIGRFYLPELIEQVLATVRPLAEQKNLNLEVEIAPQLGDFCSDSRRVQQVLLNLLSNAIKFTEQGSVRLSADLVPSVDATGVVSGGSGQMLRICVIDTGTGIKPDDLDLLFRPFRQLDAGLTRQYEGTGLGLVICLRLAELLGGEISVASEWQSGSRFCLHLPYPNDMDRGTAT